LRQVVNNPSREVAPQAGSAAWRRLKGFLFWRAYALEVAARSRPFFDSITQDDINRLEQEAAPFYLAIDQDVFPKMGEVEMHPGLDDEVARLVRESVGPAGRPLAIADFGCNKGRLLTRLREDYPDAVLTGVDVQARFQPLLEKKGIRFVHSDICATGLPAESQDVVVSTDVIEHTRHPERMIAEVHRVLRPGGVFCVLGPGCNANYNNRNPLSYFAVALGTVLESALPPFHNLYAPLTPLKIVHYDFSVQEYRRMFRRFFPEARVRTTDFLALKKFGLARIAPPAPRLALQGWRVCRLGEKVTKGERVQAQDAVKRFFAKNLLRSGWGGRDDVLFLQSVLVEITFCLRIRPNATPNPC
jgi:SAM-dependent methyltransferase